MFEMMRKVFGPVAVSVIIGAIALVFVFYGVFSPRGGGGINGGGAHYAAQVNGDEISMNEFAREYQNRVQYYQNMLKGSVNIEMFERMGLKNQVLDELVRRKLALQEAQRLGVAISDDEVRDRIQEMPYFKKDNVFNPEYYQAVLKANHQQPSEFERMVREDLMRAELMEFIRGRAKVSETEIQRAYLEKEDRRQVDYVVISRDQAKKLLIINPKEAEDLLKTEQGLKSAKDFYESRKFLYVKNAPKKDIKKELKKDLSKDGPEKTEYYSFDEVKTKVALEVIRDQRSEDLSKIVKGISDEVLAGLKKNPGSLKALAKAKGFEAQTSEKFNRKDFNLKGASDLTEITDDVFKENSSLYKEPKLYSSHGNSVIVTGLKAFKPDLNEFPKQRDQMAEEALHKKEEFLFGEWMTGLRSTAKVKIEASIAKATAPGADASEE